MDEETKKILQEQTELLRKLSDDLHSMKRAATMSKIFNLVVFFVFFIAPLILGAIYLPTMINFFTSSLGGLYGGGNTSNIDVKKILTDPNYLKQLQQQTLPK